MRLANMPKLRVGMPPIILTIYGGMPQMAKVLRLFIRGIAFWWFFCYYTAMSSDAEQKTKWTIKQLLEWTAGYLARAEVEQGRLCAEILLADVLCCQRIELYTRFDYCPGPDELKLFRQLVKRCGGHEPVAYLVGRADFYSLAFELDNSALIPRPETEVLVTEAIEYLRRQTNRPVVDVLDMCTGSGCVAVAVAVNVVEADVLALDASSEALKIAGRNVEKHELSDRVTLLQSDLFDDVNQAEKTVFDLIVSNPPYVSDQEFERLDPNVRNYEPTEALRAGEDGLEFYRRIANQAEPYLADNGAIMVEVAYNQAEQVSQLFAKCSYLTNVTTTKDNLGHQRVVKARKK